MDPKDKIALVTGAAQGLGLGIVQELLQQGIKHVSVCDIQETKGANVVEQLKEKFGKNRVIFIKTDVSKEDELEEAFKQTVSKFGGLDIVINNAGLYCDKKWQYSVSVNLNGTLQGILLALKYMGKDQEGKGGVVVNMGSIAGLGAGVSVTPVYNATKHAVVGLSRAFGSDYFWQTTGVRVMVMCPGYTKSDIIDPNLTTSITCRDEWMTQFARELEGHKPPQRMENVSEGVLHMIRKGKNGTIWVSVQDKPVYEISIPSYDKLRV